MTENKRYDVIYEKEPRGQVVTDNGIPCTARTSSIVFDGKNVEIMTNGDVE